jgi:hypothetical protein
MAKVGTLYWELKTGGRLSRLGRLKMMAAAIRRRLLNRGTRQQKAEHAITQLAALNLDAVRIPDTAAAREALEACTTASSPALLNHCARTYLFGALIGQASKLTFDTEFLYVSALLHDLGLVPAYRNQGADCHCFAVAGARAAFRLSETWNWPLDRRNRMREAIILHLNPSVPRSLGDEAHLLHAGAGADVLGTRLGELPSQLICDVFTRHPRHGIASEIALAMRAEAKKYPHGRVALWERFGFSDNIAADKPERYCSKTAREE